MKVHDKAPVDSHGTESPASRAAFSTAAEEPLSLGSRMRKVLAWIGTAILLVLTGLFLVACFLFASCIEGLYADFDQCIESGKPVVAAIEAFRQKQGQLPRRLDDLVPDFLSRTPEPADFGNCRAILYRIQEADEHRHPNRPFVAGEHYRIDLVISRLEHVWYRSDQRYNPKQDGWGPQFEIRDGWAWTRD